MADLSSILGGLKARPIDIKAEADKWLSKGFDPANQYAQYGMSPPLRQGDMASIGLDMAPGIGDIKSGIEGLQAMTKGDSLGAVLGGLGALPAVPGFAGAIKAYHGSPHLFDKFDMSKIGTGEGAQAYGHGLYFAEHPETAKAYADMGKNTIAYEGKPFLEGSPESIAAELLHSWQGDKAGAMDDALGYENAKLIQKHIQILDPARLSTSDNLYETSLEWPDPAREAADPMGPQHFLDWDRSLSEQEAIVNLLRKSRSKTLREVLAGLGNLQEPITSYGMDLGAKDGNTFLGRLSYAFEGRPTGKKASTAIAKTGIPGIRYLDQGSRGGSEGTHNYVVFDDQIPRIVSRNGEPIK